MDLTARNFCAAVLLSMLATVPAAAQLGVEVPDAAYFLGVEAFYSGDYRDAEQALRREARLGVRAGATRWIDAICTHAMLGEILYHQGRNAEALAEFDQACQVLLAYPNWLLQVRFQASPRTDLNRTRRVPPWGQSGRQFVIGQFSQTEQVMVGDINAGRAARQGGIVAAPMFWRVNVVEVIRMSALAIRRRGELLGPLAKHDPITKELSDILSRGNLSPANHWSGAWIDLLRGLSQAGIGKLDEADKLLERSLIIEGQYDHPLTCVALLEQGRVALLKGDRARASKLFAEAAFSAYYFENSDVLTESVLLGWINHVAGGGIGLYPPLDPVANWAQANRMGHVATKLRLAQAESLLSLGQLDAADAILSDVGRRIGEMRNALPGVHLLYVQAASQLTRGKIDAGIAQLTQALAAQSRVSVQNFQIARTNDMYDSRMVSPRIAVDVYSSLLSDPSALDWVVRPADTMSVLSTPHNASFDRWFIAALERKEAPLALEIAERAKRRRFLATRPLGGRISALRFILEGPQGQLSKEAVLQRQQILAAFPAYRQLSEVSQKTYDQLRAGPVIATGAADTKALASLYSGWRKNADQREQMIAQLAVRRMPTSLETPPLRSTVELQKSLGDGEALAIFHSVGGGLYGFLLTKNDAVIWQPGDSRKLRANISNLLQDLGNFGASRQISLAELKNDKWRDAATDVFQGIFADARLDLAKTTGLIIVPDDVLWYLPFEVLVPDAAAPETVLADRVLLRYGPTAAMAVANPQPLRRPQRTGIVSTGSKKEADDAIPTAEMLDELGKVVSGPVRVPSPLPEPAQLISVLLDELISFDEVDTTQPLPAALLPAGRGRSGSDGASTWFGLPFGGPERIILSGFSTAAEQGLKGSRRTSSGGNRPGDEVFQKLCEMMENGARAVLLTRWRTGGRTNFELVREFARELPNAPANEAWQRACLLARETPLEVTREPRLKRSDETGEQPTADHPFFWAGYLLVDTSPSAALEDDVEQLDPSQPPAAAGAPPQQPSPPGRGQGEGAEAKVNEKPAVEKPLPPPDNREGEAPAEPNAPTDEP